MSNPQHNMPSSLRQDEVTNATPAAAGAATALLSSSPSLIDAVAAAAPNDAEEEDIIEIEYKGGRPKVDTYLYPPNQKINTEPFTKNKKKQQHQHKRPSPTLREILAGRVGPYLLVIPPTVTAIDDDACRGCTGLRGVQFHPQVTYIGYRAFYKKHQLRLHGQLPYNLLRIEEKAFSHCRALVDLTIPPYVQWMDQEAFSWCTSLQRVRFETLRRPAAASSATTLHTLRHHHHHRTLDRSTSITRGNFCELCPIAIPVDAPRTAGHRATKEILLQLSCLGRDHDSLVRDPDP